MATLDAISLGYLLKVALLFVVRLAIAGMAAGCAWGAVIGIGSFFQIGQAGIHSDLAWVTLLLAVIVWGVLFRLLGRLLPFPAPNRADPYVRK